MAGVCDICGRHPGFGMKVSHSHRRSKRRWLPNVQKIRVQVDGGGAKRRNVCAKCLKAGKVRRAV